MNVRLLARVALVLATLPVFACGGDDELIVGAASSLQDSGILDELVNEFKELNPNIGLKPVAGGSGQVMELASRGELDVTITHSPVAEAELIAAGDGVERRPFMHNSFVIVGPDDDPARVREATSMADAFSRIAQMEAPFVSRGDLSGTHVRELAVWESAGVDPEGRSWFQESGTNQGASLLLASDRQAYTLVDSATWAALVERTGLTLLLIDEEVPNVYSVTLVNPEKHSVNEPAARAFADFLTSPPGQAVIERFGREEYGEPLFTPGVPRANP